MYKKEQFIEWLQNRAKPASRERASSLGSTMKRASSLGSTMRKRVSSLGSTMSSASNLASSTGSRLRSVLAPRLFGSASIENKVWTRVIGNKEWSLRKISVSDNVLYKMRGDNSYDCGVRSECPCSMVS